MSADPIRSLVHCGDYFEDQRARTMVRSASYRWEVTSPTRRGALPDCEAYQVNVATLDLIFCKLLILTLSVVAGTS